MSQPINLTYKFHSTGELESQGEQKAAVDPTHRLFSRFIGSVRQLGMDSAALLACTVDFRTLYYADREVKNARQIQCLITFSFRLALGTGQAEFDTSLADLSRYCESLLTFTFRQHNFTIERAENPIVVPAGLSHIIEILRPIDLSTRQNKLVPEPFKAPVNIRKLANLLVRHGRPIGYALTVDLQGLSSDERALVVQAGIEGQDPLSKLGERFALPLSSEDTEAIDQSVRPVCKLRIFSSSQPSPFFTSELLECIAPTFPRTVNCSRTGDAADKKRFALELRDLESFGVTADSDITFAPWMQPLMRKVYRSLGIDEIANIAPFPRQPVPGVVHKQYRTFVPPISDLSLEGVLLGTVRTEASAEANEVRIPTQDRLRHMYVLGKTGTGKSSFLASLIIQDILESRSVVVLDPHGDLCDDVISALPEAALDRVVLVDPTLSAAYPGCNLNVLDFGGRTPQSEDEIAQFKDYWTSELTSMFLALYGGEVFGPRIQEYFRAACLTLMDPAVGGTLADVPRLFTESEFRKKCRDALTDPYAGEFWKVFDETGGHEQQEIIPYFSSKFAPLVRSHIIRGFIGQSVRGVDIDEQLTAGRAVLVRLSKGRLGEIGMRLIGMLLLAKLKAAIFSRQSQEPAMRRPVVFYVDEFQNFVFEGFQTLLSEARKYGMGLVLAHQYLSQMKQAQFQLYGSGDSIGLLDAILGNVGSLALFRVGAQDASQIVPHVGDPVEARDLVNIESYEFVARILNRGVMSAPMTVASYRHELLSHATSREELKVRTEFLMERFRL